MSRILLAAFLAFTATADAADKGKKKEAIKKHDNVLVAELQHSHRVLDLADPIYHGHRAKARHEINAAIGELQKEMHKHGMKVHKLGDHVKVPKNLSDSLVRETAKELATILKQINSLTKTKHRTKAAEHIAKALVQLEEAFASVTVKPVKTPK